MTCGHFPHVLGWVILLTPFGLFDFSAAENGSNYANFAGSIQSHEYGYNDCWIQFRACHSVTRESEQCYW